VAHRWRLGLEQDVPVSELTVGETVRVRPGERLPVDGTILSGTSEIDNSLLTGEATPEPRGPGDSVWAGTSNGRGILEVQVGKVGPDTFLAHLQELMTDAELNQVPVQKFADRVASAFVPVVLALGVLAAVGWYAFGGASGTVALLIFVSVVITACPCAFGIATPAAVIVATGRAAESGVLFKGRDAIERTGAVDVVLADKTGTLTLGRPRLKEVVVAPGWTKEDVLRLAAAVELGSEHPLARAVVEAARAEGAAVGVASEVVAQPGIGIYGTVDGATVEVRLLSASAETEGTSGLSPDPTAHFAREGWTSSVVSVGGKPAGWLGFEDPVRPEVPAAVAELGELGLEVMVVSGDNEAAVSRAARDAGIVEFRSRIRPDDKVRLVEEVQARNHRVAFVGDGLNDAAALTAAYAGIAVGTGTDVTKEAGRVILVRPDFRGVPLAVRTARSTLRKIRQNIFWAIGYNAFLLPIAAGILVPWTGFSVYAILPVTGAIAMGISSTTVLLNSLSLRRIPSPKGLPRTPGSSRDAIPA
jgi:Cu+-exporting ATPase